LPQGACLRRHRFARLRGRKHKGNHYKWGNLFKFCLIQAGFYLALGAVLCLVIGVGAVKRLFQGAKRAEPPDPQRRPPSKD